MTPSCPTPRGAESDRRPRPATRIVADVGERRSRIPDWLARRAEIELVVARLAVGDYLADGRAVFERKTVDDLALSIRDGRLFRQVGRLATAPWWCALIVEGALCNAYTAMSRQAVTGALLAVTLRFGVPVLCTTDAADTARLLVFAARQLARGGRALAPAAPRRPDASSPRARGTPRRRPRPRVGAARSLRHARGVLCRRRGRARRGAWNRRAHGGGDPRLGHHAWPSDTAGLGLRLGTANE
jgi:hypothetical protein